MCVHVFQTLGGKRTIMVNSDRLLRGKLRSDLVKIVCIEGVRITIVLTKTGAEQLLNNQIVQLILFLLINEISTRLFFSFRYSTQTITLTKLTRLQLDSIIIQTCLLSGVTLTSTACLSSVISRQTNGFWCLLYWWYTSFTVLEIYNVKTQK